jgi:hypothetical protein
MYLQPLQPFTNSIHQRSFAGFASMRVGGGGGIGAILPYLRGSCFAMIHFRVVIINWWSCFVVDLAIGDPDYLFAHLVESRKESALIGNPKFGMLKPASYRP